MNVYEVKVIITSQLAREYYRWLKPHAQQLVDTGCFTKYELQQESAGSRSIFRCHYYYNRPEDFEKYVTEFAKNLRSNVPDKFRGNMEILRSNFTVAEANPTVTNSPAINNI